MFALWPKEKDMSDRNCVVVFHQATGRVTGQILQGEEVVKELELLSWKASRNRTGRCRRDDP